MSERPPQTPTGVMFDQAQQWERRAKKAEAEVERLRGAIEDYLLWEPGRMGHAEAHNNLHAALGRQPVHGHPSEEKDRRYEPPPDGMKNPLLMSHPSEEKGHPAKDADRVVADFPPHRRGEPWPFEEKE